MPVLVFGNLEIRPEAGEVRLRQVPVPVTRTEFRLLCELALHPGRVLSRAQLLERVWEYAFGDERLVDVHVGRLRQKIEGDPGSPQRLVTVRGMGTSFSDETAGPACAHHDRLRGRCSAAVGDDGGAVVPADPRLPYG
jgi:DNA-binding response OmpR family regulator